MKGKFFHLDIKSYFIKKTNHLLSSVAILTKGNNYQSITQTYTRFDIVRKTGKHFLPQIHLQQLIQLSYQISTVILKSVLKKYHRYFDEQAVLR